eukprot:scaffold204435_cov33-Tisochrysis_lutea.AAC.2
MAIATVVSDGFVERPVGWALGTSLMVTSPVLMERTKKPSALDAATGSSDASREAAASAAARVDVWTALLTMTLPAATSAMTTASRGRPTKAAMERRHSSALKSEMEPESVATVTVLKTRIMPGATGGGAGGARGDGAHARALANPRPKGGNPHVDAWHARLGALETKRDDADEHTATTRHDPEERPARVALARVDTALLVASTDHIVSHGSTAVDRAAVRERLHGHVRLLERASDRPSVRQGAPAGDREALPWCLQRRVAGTVDLVNGRTPAATATVHWRLKL